MRRALGEYALDVIPHVAPPVWPDIRPARFANAIVRNQAELLEQPASARELLDKCSVALLGLPDDTGVELNAGRIGARQGPQAIRAALARYGVASPADSRPDRLAFPRVFDAGDVIPGADIHETHRRVSDAAEAATRLGMIPIGLGGGHDLTFALVRGVARALAPLDGVYLDAHLDVRPEVGSGMPFRALIEHALVGSLRVVGLNPLANDTEHARFFTEHNGSILTPGRALSEPRLFESARAMFLSVDLDAIDASAAPGVSAPNPCGMTPVEAESLVRLGGRSPHVRCFDVMELCPPHDHEGRTARLAAHLLLTFLRGVGERSAPAEHGATP